MQWPIKQEAQLPQRDSASATHVFLGSINDRALHWAPHLFYNYTGWAKKVSLIIFAITLSTASQFSQFLARMHCRKFATRGYIVSSPEMIYVTTLPCKILATTFFTLNSIHCCKKSSFFTSVVIIANFCKISFKKIIPDEYYLFSSNGYALVAMWSIAIAADYVINVNVRFEQFARAMGIYSAKNPLWPWITFR